MLRTTSACLALLGAAGLAAAQTAPRRALSVDDMNRVISVGDPQCSPDGHQVAYTVSTTDVKADRRGTHVWLMNADGSGDRQITSSESSESSPRWSPDGKYLSFTSSRPGPAKGNQVWLLDRRGGEATQLTAIEKEGSLESYAWSPDSTRLALVIHQPAPETKPGEPPKPIIIDRYKFKEDRIGYLDDRVSFIYIFDLATRKAERLTTGNFNESNPVWSPDGNRIAFMSNHDPESDRELDGQLYVVDVRPGAVERALTRANDFAEGGRPAWSPDGKWLAFTVGAENKWGAYTMQRLAVVAADGTGAVRIVAPALDRGVSSPRFTADGSGIEVSVADDRTAYQARIGIADGSEQKLLTGPMVVSAVNTAGACRVGLVGHDDRATEVYALDGTAPRQLTHQNDKLFAELKLGTVRDLNFTSQDGTEVHGLLTLPVDYIEGSKVPFLLRIHGGPNGQDAHSFNMEAQQFAANGYAVLAVNYRGSSGRGSAYQRAIASDWGHLEVQDLEAGVNKILAMGIADPMRLGVGGWSYGGILTDYMIASDPRFKAATVGAGTAFTVAFYGTDQYIIQYNYEIGPPWNPQAWATYQKISYPFLHADRIKTPTLFLNGDRDFNVPIQGNQEMYEALKTLDIPTEMVIYPGEWHGITRPSFQHDRMQRYLDWYAKYLKATASEASRPN